MSTAAQRFTLVASSKKAATFNPMPKTNAREGEMRLPGTGRCDVRLIRASMSWSKKWLIALAPPAPKAPPAHTSNNVAREGTPCAARNMPPTAVTSNKEIMGGLVSVK